MAPSNTAVLIVEDDPQTERLERRLLEDDGYTVQSVTSGEEAIALVSDSEPDLILLDIGLPGIDGFTTCMVLRKFSQVRIIMVTGRDATTDKVKGIEIGADDYVAKPFVGDELLVRARAVMRRNKSFRSNDSGTGPRKIGGLMPVIASKAGPRLAEGVSRIGNSGLRTNLRAGLAKSKLSGQRLVRDLRRNGVKGLIDGRRNCANYTSGEPRPEGQNHHRLTWSQRMAAVKSWWIKAAYTTWTYCRVQGLRAGGYLRTQLRRAESSPGLRRFIEAVARFGNDELEVTFGKYGIKIINARGNRPAAEPAPLEDVSSQAITRDKSASVELALAAEVSPSEEAAASPGSLFNQRAGDSYHLNLLDAMLTSYLNQASAKCENPMLAVPVIPIVDIYSQVAEILGKDETYTRQDFAQDIYRLQVSGVDTTLTGARVQLPISRGVPGKTLTVLDESGGEVRYFGVRFIQTEKLNAEEPALDILPDDSDGELRSFESLEAPTYEMELRDILGRLSEWPSPEFAEFLASQIKLKKLSGTELRQFAQIARDALHRDRREPGDSRSRNDSGGAAT
ncbi:MAG: response regulator transcription factor [Chloroflexi bacterium]|nr:response regulator transcription factor [Chloroflexota bacterium]